MGGLCGSPAAIQDEYKKPDDYKEDVYSNDNQYFLYQCTAMLTHETHDESETILQAFLLSHVYFSDSLQLLKSIRERFFMDYHCYCAITYETESIDPTVIADIVSNSEDKASKPRKNTVDSNSDDMKPYILSTDVASGASADSNIQTVKLSEEEWVTEIRQKIQTKCIHLLLFWIENYWSVDFSDNKSEMKSEDSQPSNECLQYLQTFITAVKESRDRFENTEYTSWLQSQIFEIENTINKRSTWLQNLLDEQATMKKDRNHHLLILKQRSLSGADLSPSPEPIDEMKLPESAGSAPKETVASTSRKASTTTTATTTAAKQPIGYTPSFKSQEAAVINSISPLANMHSGNRPLLETETNCNLAKLANRENAKRYAQQLTLMDYENFIAIHPRQFISKVVNKKNESSYQQLAMLTERFQATYQWVRVTIITQPSLKERIQIIEFFISFSESLLKIGNFYSFMAVCTALDHPKVRKVKTAWSFVGPSGKRKYEHVLAPLCDGAKNYAKLRDKIARQDPPGIPFLGIALKDITFINDGSPDRLEDINNQINFHKYQRFYEACNEVVRLQSISYFDTLSKDTELQSEIAADMQSYNLLTENVLGALATEADRFDTQQKSAYEAQMRPATTGGKNSPTSENKGFFDGLFGRRGSDSKTTTDARARGDSLLNRVAKK